MEKKEFKGKIENIEVKTFEKDGNEHQRGVFIINSMRLATFDTNVINAFKVGDMVMGEYTESQKGSITYKNISSIMYIGDIRHPEPEKENVEEIKPSQLGNGRKDMVLMSLWLSPQELTDLESYLGLETEMLASEGHKKLHQILYNAKSRGDFEKR